MFLNLPKRACKPRNSGLSLLIDNGLPTKNFEDILTSHEPIIDCVKLGWGTSLVTQDLQSKLSILRNLGLDYYFGGTLFEKALLQNKLREFVKFCSDHSCKYVEVSNGTIDLKNPDKAKFIKSLSDDFLVLSEVGYKDSGRSQDLPPSKWIEYIQEDLAAGSVKVITESRESGKSGICRDNGEIRYGLVEEIIDSGVGIDNLIFEAPNKSLQTFFVRKVGPNVNLGNIAFTDIVGLETLRLGLRSDTLLQFEDPRSDTQREAISESAPQVSL